jgi:hypothetical protein
MIMIELWLEMNLFLCVFERVKVLRILKLQHAIQHKSKSSLNFVEEWLLRPEKRILKLSYQYKVKDLTLRGGRQSWHLRAPFSYFPSIWYHFNGWLIPRVSRNVMPSSTTVYRFSSRTPIDFWSWRHDTISNSWTPIPSTAASHPRRTKSWTTPQWAIVSDLNKKQLIFGEIWGFLTSPHNTISQTNRNT